MLSITCLLKGLTAVSSESLHLEMRKKIKVKFSKDINQNGLFNIHTAVCFTPAGFLFCFVFPCSALFTFAMSAEG